MASDSKPLKVRTSIRELMKDPVKTNTFLKAFKKIQELHPEDPDSFWTIAGYHGEPFSLPIQMESAQRSDPQMDSPPIWRDWGGYCQHANVLFPTWHRFYVLRLEEALRKASGDDDLTFPYWDQTSEESLNEGIPKLVTDEIVTIDGKRVANPLRSFILPRDIGFSDKADGDFFYMKPKDYKTVRYPWSGINSPPKEKKIADVHNKKITDGKEDDVKLLNKNVTYMLDEKKSGKAELTIKDQYIRCLQAVNYTVFSNTTAGKPSLNMPLESPHNYIHLAVGGVAIPPHDGADGEISGIIAGGNGDMGENETAGFDPIFFFHHCNVDRMFWLWQKSKSKTESFEIDQSNVSAIVSPYRGQGPSPTQKDGEELNMDSILYPFKNVAGGWATSNDCINIEKQLGYTYSNGSLEEFAPVAKEVGQAWHETFYSLSDIKAKLKSMPKDRLPTRHIFDISSLVLGGESADIPFHLGELGIVGTSAPNKVKLGNNTFIPGEINILVHNVNRDIYVGSFFVSAYYKSNGGRTLIGRNAILDRWRPSICKNCMKHRVLNLLFYFSPNIVKVTFPLKAEDFELEASFNDPRSETGHVIKNIEIGGIYDKASSSGESEMAAKDLKCSLKFCYITTSENEN